MKLFDLLQMIYSHCLLGKKCQAPLERFYFYQTARQNSRNLLELIFLIALSCSIGYWICEEKMGQGLMSEAINLIKKFIFDELDLHRLEAACLPVNKRSLRTLKNNGFAIEGLVRKYLKINGNWEDHFLLSCIKNESL